MTILQKANEWHDASKELPELRRVATPFIADANWKGDSIVVLVSRPTFTCEPVTMAYLADFGNGPVWRHPNGQFVGNIYPVTHWRELPAPPKRAEIAPEDLKSNHAEWEEMRDDILNERGSLAEGGLDSDQVNAVLSIVDDHEPPRECPVPQLSGEEFDRCVVIRKQMAGGRYEEMSDCGKAAYDLLAIIDRLTGRKGGE